MRGLLLLASGIKNNFKQMLPIVIAIALTIGYAFSMSAFLVKIMFADLDWEVWLSAAITFAILCAICMMFIYSAYFKVSAVRIRTARVLGARHRDIVISVLVEAVILCIVGVLIGIACDTIINSMVCLFIQGTHEYLTIKTFFVSLGITLIVPLLSTITVLLLQFIRNRVFSINR